MRAEVVGHERVRLAIAEKMAVERGISRTVAQRRGSDDLEAAVGLCAGRRDVVPLRAAVARHLHESVIRADPDLAPGERRAFDIENRIGILGTGDVERERAARRLLMRFVVAREIGTDRLPGGAAIARREYDVTAEPHGVRIPWRKRDG
jgi:hypothetical protein